MKVRVGKKVASILVLSLLSAAAMACGGRGPAMVTTLAGKAGVKGSADGRGEAACFNDPAGIACDAAGNLYVADGGNNTIRKITPAGVVTTLAGRAGSFGSSDGTGAAARFNGPGGLARDAAGNLYVADVGNEMIRKITPAGQVITFAGRAGGRGSTDGTGAAARFNSPVCLALDAAGNLYVSDADNNKIRKITPAGLVTTLAGSGGQGSIDGKGAAASFDNPAGIVCDAAGNLFVADWNGSTIRKITPAGVVTTLAGSDRQPGSADGTGAAARFTLPSGIALDAAGNLYVTDSFSATIREITPDRVVSTLAGKAGVRGSADGSAGAARFTNPVAITIDSAGNLYVVDGADGGNNTIRKITWSQ